METILTVVHLFLAIGLVGLVLMQHGKGADAGAAFGSGASATVFGSQGSANFLSRTTGVFAALFFMTSLWLAYYAMQSTETESLMDAVPAAVETAPAIEVNNSDIPVVPEIEQFSVESDVPAVASPIPAVESSIPAPVEMPIPVIESPIPESVEMPAETSSDMPSVKVEQ